jgi:hypothetical protein
MIFDVLKRGFLQGCGISLAEALQSRRYTQILERERALPEKYDAQTPQGIALRVGALQMSPLLNTLLEDEAIVRARSLTEKSYSPEYRAQLIFFGERLVREAEECLPDEILSLADTWNSSSSDQQLAMTRQLFEVLIDDQQMTRQELTPLSAFQRIWDAYQDNVEKTDHAILPRCYGKWTKKRGPNCQGKTQMITAFARRAGAPVYCVSPIVSASQVLDSVREAALDRIVEDLSCRGLLHVDKALFDGILGSMTLRDSAYAREPFFHVAAAVQLRDGRWVLIDSHNLTWGVFGSEWNMEKVDRILSVYGEVVPGITVHLENESKPKAYFDEKMASIEECLAKSHELEKALRDAGDQPLDVFDVFAASGMPKFVAQNQGIDLSAHSEIFQEAFTHMLFWGGDPFEEAAKMKTDCRGYLAQKIGSFATFYHMVAMNNLCDQDRMNGRLLHPICEFSLPEYHLAIGVFNSLGVASSEQNRFLLEHSCDQVTIMNALNEGIPMFFDQRDKDPDIAEIASRLLESLPYRHPSCTMKQAAYTRAKGSVNHES